MLQALLLTHMHVLQRDAPVALLHAVPLLPHLLPLLLQLLLVLQALVVQLVLELVHPLAEVLRMSHACIMLPLQGLSRLLLLPQCHTQLLPLRTRALQLRFIFIW